MSSLQETAPAQASIVLASSSSYRRNLLQRLNVSFTCHSPDVDETPMQDESGLELAKRLATAKAFAVGEIYPNATVIGSDQVAVLHRDAKPSVLLGKPHNYSKAVEQLENSSGNTVTFYTAICLRKANSEETFHHMDETNVRFRVLTKTQINRYIDIEQPFDCAGSFKCEGLGIRLFETIENQDPTALIGLPLIGLCNLLLNVGIDPL